MLRRANHMKVEKAVKTQTTLGLVHPRTRGAPWDCAPVYDPLQFFVERLVDRLEKDGQDVRSEAMLEVLFEKYPQLSWGRYLRLRPEEPARRSVARAETDQ